MAISLLLSDWYLTPEVLDEVSTQLRAGGTIDDPRDAIIAQMSADPGNGAAGR